MRPNRLFLLIFIIFYVFGVVYPVLRLWMWLVPYPLMTLFIPIVLVAIPAVPRFMRPRRRGSIGRTMNVFLMTWLGLYFELALVIYPLEIWRLFVDTTDQTLGLVALATWLVLGLFSFLNAQRIAISRLTISNSNAVAGKTLAHITDIHIGTHSKRHLERITRKLKQLNPDAILITGDLVDSARVVATDLEPLRELSAPCLYTIGNHERYENCDAIVEWLRGHGVTVLRNEAVELKPFQFIGIDDAESPETVKNALADLEPAEGLYRVLLYHRPQGHFEAAKWGVNLMMCGHTHHGQVFPFHLIVKRFFKIFRGTHDIDGMTLHIGPGTGTWGPRLRLGTRNEIAHVAFN